MLTNKRKGLFTPTKATIYKILIASPSDVEEERKVVPEVINSWNAVNSDHYGVRLEPVLWETHATPEMGKRPQAIINKQLVETCDILVALFWTRLGTPTGEAESGTVEEIKEFQKAGKPVLLYFSSINVPPENIDLEHLDQYKKLLEFKRHCEKEGLVTTYKSIDELRMKLQMHITQKINSIHKVDNGKKSPRYIEVTFTGIKEPKFLTGIKEPKSLEATSAPKEIRNATVNPRVYDERKLPSIGSAELPSYKWDANNFEGFWYDLKTGITGETLVIEEKLEDIPIDHIYRIIPENTLWYSTARQAKTLKALESGIFSLDLHHAFGAGGTYSVVGWQGQPYVAIKDNAKKLTKLIIEQGNATSEKKSLSVGETWDIGDGWTLTAQSIDAKASPRQVWLVLSKDGTKLDDRVIAQGQVYVYTEKNFAGESDVPLFVTYVDSVIAGETSDIVQLRYTWAIGTLVTEIQSGDVFGNMEVTSTTNNFIELKNKDNSLELTQGGTVDIMGNLKFKVADDPNFLRFYPVVLREQ